MKRGGADFVDEAAKAFNMPAAEFGAIVKRWNGYTFDPAMGGEGNAVKNELQAIITKMKDSARERAEEALAELIRRQQEALKRWREHEAARLKKEASEAAKRLEKKRQEKLRNMGKCVAGFPWIHQGNGFYRCAGGSHTHQFSSP